MPDDLRDWLVRSVYVAAVGMVAGLVSTYTSMTLSTSIRVSSLERDVAFIKEAITRIEKRN